MPATDGILNARVYAPLCIRDRNVYSVSSHRAKPANVTIINDRFLLHDAVVSCSRGATRDFRRSQSSRDVYTESKEKIIISEFNAFLRIE